MKIDIDWSEAPAWAFGHGLISFQGITRVWFNDEQYAVYDRDGGPYPWGGGKGDTRHNHTRSAVEYVTHRPEPWTGEGLPPVGTVCEVKGCIGHYQEWKPVTVFAVRGNTVLFDHENGWDQTASHEFRPIRTPEQIAEQKRHTSAVKMFNIFCEANNLTGADMKGFYALYDAGFLQQATND